MNTVERELTTDEIREIDDRFADDVRARAELYGITHEQAANELRARPNALRGPIGPGGG